MNATIALFSVDDYHRTVEAGILAPHRVELNRRSDRAIGLAIVGGFLEVLLIATVGF